MTNEEKERIEAAEQEFKDSVFKIFSSKIPGAYRDEDGFIVIKKHDRFQIKVRWKNGRKPYPTSNTTNFQDSVI